MMDTEISNNELRYQIALTQNMQTKISTSTCKYAHEKTRNNATTQQLNNSTTRATLKTRNRKNRATKTTNA